MDLITDTFIIFSCLMFWIVFHNKKGLLSEIKKTEKKISEKITVLEDLLDQHNLALKKVQASVTEPNPVQESVLPAIDAELINVQNNTIKLKLEPQITSDFQHESNQVEDNNLNLQPEEKASTIYESNTELRVLGLPEELIEDSEIDELELIPVLPKQSKDKDDVKKSEPNDNYLTGVQNMVLEAKENLLKIDVSDVQEIRTFKDVVLMSKKIEMEKQQIKFK